jgi:hypothetical protein
VFLQIEDLNQQAQVAVAEKIVAPEVSQAAEAGGNTTVRDTSYCTATTFMWFGL